MKDRKTKDVVRTRSFTIEKARAVASEGGEKKIRIAISSESPVMAGWILGHERCFEVLSHDAESVDLSYFNSGAPFLFEHSTRDHVGILEGVTIDDDRVMRADVRFSNSEFAQQILDDIERGIRPNISVGFMVHQYQDTGETLDGVPVVRAVRWTPVECSSVVIPADLSVGVGRSKSVRNVEDLLIDLTDEEKATLLAALTAVEDTTEEKAVDDEEAVADVKDEEIAAESEAEDEETDSEDEDSDEKRSKGLIIDNDTATIAVNNRMEKITMSDKVENGSNVEAERVRKVTDLAVKYGMTDKLANWITEARSVDSVSGEILETRANDKTVIQAPAVHTRDNKSYSVSAGIEALFRGGNSLAAEMGQDVAASRGIAPNARSLYIAPDMELFKRTITTAANGANYLANEYLSFEQGLAEESVLGKLGVQLISPTNIVKVPRGTNVAGAWVTEGGSITAASGSTGVLTLSPKLFAVAIPYSRTVNAATGEYPVEQILRQEIAAVFAEGLETAVFSSGSTGPTGIYLNADVPIYGSASGSLNTAAVAGMWATARANKVSANNFKWVTTPMVFASGSQAAQVASVSQLITSDGKMFGYPVFNSALMPTNVAVNGASHGLIGGDFTKVIAATWLLEIIVDDFSAASTGVINLRGFLHADAGVRNPNALIKHIGINV